MKMKLIILFISALLVLPFAACGRPDRDVVSPTVQDSSDAETLSEPLPNQNIITFDVIFDENHSCIVDGPDRLPVGKYTFRLDDRSGLNVDLNVVHLIDGHGYQDLLDLQEKPGEPFVKVYWMSLPFYFTTDHIVWTYTLDEPGEHAILILQHVFEGSWICDPFLVVE